MFASLVFLTAGTKPFITFYQTILSDNKTAEIKTERGDLPVLKFRAFAPFFIIY